MEIKSFALRISQCDLRKMEVGEHSMKKEAIKKPSLDLIAEEIINKVLKTNDPFQTPIVVGHNTKVLQWIKAFFLKTSDKILMNVRFETLSVFLNGVINPDRKYTIMDKRVFREYIIHELLTPGKYDQSNEEAIRYIFTNGKINGIHLYELADKLAELFNRYEFDEENMQSFGWEYDVYRAVICAAEDDGFFTTKRLYEKQKAQGELKKITDPVYIINNSYITELFQEMLKEICGEQAAIYEIASCGKPCVPVVFSAPTPLREIEELHTRISTIVKTNKSVRYNDFLVYAPDINVYADVITRVFKQDGSTYPSIPFRITGEIKEKKDMSDALNVLFDIANKRFFTRKDFCRFAKNKMIQRVHDFTDDDLEVWLNVIIETNTYRNGKENDDIPDDWDYLAKRLLISLLVSNSSALENETILAKGRYLPYSDMDLDAASMAKLLDVVKMLGAWCALFTDDLNALYLKKRDVENVRICMDRMFSGRKANGAETNYLYREVAGELDCIGRIFDGIPANTMMQLLMNALSGFVSYPADMFAAGVTFMSLNCDDIVSAKYVYVLGLSSKDFPRITVKNEIDKSVKHKTEQDLDEIAIQNILRNAENAVFSYVNSDTKTEEPFYPSTLLMDAAGIKAEETEDIETVPLDETRPYEKLFTRKEFMDKAYYLGLTSAPVPPKAASGPVGHAAEKRIELRTKDIRDFLENTYFYKLSAVLGKKEDKNRGVRKEFEPLDVDDLSRYNVIKYMVECTDDDEMKKKLSFEKALPSGKLGADYCDAFLKVTVNSLRLEINTGYTALKLEPLTLHNGGTDWTLSLSDSVYRKEAEDDLYYLEARDAVLRNRITTKFYLVPYVASLMDVAGRADDGKTYNIHLGPAAAEKKYQVTRAKAQELLNSAETLMTDYGDLRYMDIAFIEDIAKGEEGKKDKNPGSLKEFAETLYTHADWKYSEFRDLVDPYHDLGYSEAGFSEQFGDMYDRMKNLIVFI